jgi:hypothetical protein
MSALYSAMDRDAELTTRDVLAAMEGSPPLSVTRAEQIDALRAWARHRCVSAD